MQKNFIELNNINKTFDDGLVAIKNMNLQIEKGEFITLLGPSGCGKTTTLKMIAGFEQPTYGQIKINGVDVKDLPVYLRPTATVFQDYALFPHMTVWQNICYGLKVMYVPNEKIDKVKLQKSEQVFAAAVKEANEKIKSAIKKRNELLNSLQKVRALYTKNEWNSENMEMRNLQFKTKVFELKTQLRDPNNIKNILTIKNEIKKLKNNYKQKKVIDNKYDRLVDAFNKADYLVAYWETYPYVKRENYENKVISRHLTKKEIKQRAEKVIELIGLKGKENKYPDELSGGMKQRVALARAIVIEPEILLLDEPLSALDAKVRKLLQKELKRLHKELKITFILVTHDQEEALTLSDRVVVINDGKIIQIGTPNDVYDSPINPWVAQFLGAANIFDGTYHDIGKVKVDENLIFDTDIVEGFDINEKIKILIRPEDFDVLPENQGFFNVTVLESIYKGVLHELKCRMDNGTEIVVENIDDVPVGSKIGVEFNKIDVHVMHNTDEE